MPYRALRPREEEAARSARRRLSKGGSVLEHVSRDHEFAQSLVLVIHRLARFLKHFVEAVAGSANVLHCNRTVLIGFFEGVEGGGHAQSGFPQPHGFRPPSVAIIGHWVRSSAGPADTIASERRPRGRRLLKP